MIATPFSRASRDFATDELMPALLRGNTLDSETFNQVRDRLAYFTGLSPQFVERSNLRVDGTRFRKELLRDEGLAVGRADARYTRDDIDDLGSRPEGDASSEAMSAAFKTSLMVHMHDELAIDWDRTYMYPADGALYSSWNWQPVPDGQGWEPLAGKYCQRPLECPANQPLTQCHGGIGLLRFRNSLLRCGVHIESGTTSTRAESNIFTTMAGT